MLSITVAIPVFNAERHIQKALLSISSQTFKDYELLIIDNASTDNTLNLVSQFQKRNPQLNMRVVENQENKGLGASKNTAIQQAHGKYLFFMDSDDYIEDFTLDYLFNATQPKEVEVVVGSFICESEKGEKVFEIINFDQYKKKQYALTESDVNFYHMTWNKLYLVDFLRKNDILCIPAHLHEDLWFSFQISAIAQAVVMCQRITYHYVNNSQSICSKGNSGFNDKNAIEHIEILEYEYQYITQKKLYTESWYHIHEYLVLFTNTVYSICLGQNKENLLHRLEVIFPPCISKKVPIRYRIFYWTRRIFNFKSAIFIDFHIIVKLLKLCRFLKR